MAEKYCITVDGLVGEVRYNTYDALSNQVDVNTVCGGGQGQYTTAGVPNLIIGPFFSGNITLKSHTLDGLRAKHMRVELYVIIILQFNAAVGEW